MFLTEDRRFLPESCKEGMVNFVFHSRHKAGERKERECIYANGVYSPLRHQMIRYQSRACLFLCTKRPGRHVAA